MPTPRARPDRRGIPPIWLGCDALAWARLLARNRFACDRSRLPTVAVVSAAAVLNSVLGLVQQIFYRGRVARTPVGTGPVFILGHWRSGTTLLHELLACDPRHAAPTTYQCFVPHHFLLSASWLPRLLGRLASVLRPMDNMAAGWDRPQEDEFALCLGGQPSLYERIAFPNRPQAGAGVLDPAGLPRAAVRGWLRAFRGLVQAVTYRNPGKRLILKSPPHTCRIATLLRLFPAARFIHIVRDPYAIYPSTLHLWRVLWTAHGLQRPSWEQLPEYILTTFLQMHARLEEGKRLVPPGRFVELRHETLVRDPIAELERIYRDLDLGDFDPARQGVEAYLAGVRGYEANRYLLTPEERHTITQRWGEVIRRQGYEVRVD